MRWLAPAAAGAAGTSRPRKFRWGDGAIGIETMSSSFEERKCVTCGDTDDVARLEKCSVCRKDFCPDCAHRALGRRFCSPDCSRAFFYGDQDDDEDGESDDD